MMKWRHNDTKKHYLNVMKNKYHALKPKACFTITL